MKRTILIASGVLVLMLASLNWIKAPPTEPPEFGGEAMDSNTGPAGSSPPDNSGITRPNLSHAPIDRPSDSRSPLEAVALDLQSRNSIPMEVKLSYIEAHKGSFDSYLATRDKALLNEAAAKYPDEPQVQFAVLSSNLFPEERRKWIDALKASDPDNSIANYLSAADFLKNGQRDEAFNELKQAMSKDRFDDYMLDNFQNTEEFLSHAGYSNLSAKYASVQDLELSHLPDMRRIATELATEYQRLEGAQRYEEADELATLGLRLGQQMSLGDASRTLIGQLVGIAVEKKMLSVMDPTRKHSGLPLPVEEMRSALQRQQDELQSLKTVIPDVLRPVAVSDEQTLIHYLERFKLHGEEEALQWLKRQKGE